MSNPGLDFVLYLGPVGNAPSDQCRRLHSQLNDQSRARIKIMDYGEITRALGPKKPAWLRGFPTLVSYESPPRVLEGTPVITTLQEWVQRQSSAAQQQSPSPQQQHSQRSAQHSQRNESQRSEHVQAATAVPGLIDQSSDGGRYGSVVSDDLYVSQMVSKHGGGAADTSSRGRVTSSEIEAFNRSRATRN